MPTPKKPTPNAIPAPAQAEPRAQETVADATAMSLGGAMDAATSDMTPTMPRLAKLHQDRPLGTPPEPDNGPVEPWRVQQWVAEVLATTPVCLDTETTGTNGTVVEVGVVNLHGEVVFHAYIQPLEPIDPAASAKTGLTAERLESLGARPWSEVAPQLEAAIGDAAVLQYANSFFDRAALERTDRGAGIDKTLANTAWVDVMDAYQHCNGLCKSMKLIEAAADMGVVLSETDAHGAVADARATMGVFRNLADRNLAERMAPHEVLVHLGEQGNLEAYTPEGTRLKPHQITGDRLRRAYEEAASQWPSRAKTFFEKGDFIRIPVGDGWTRDRASHVEHFPAILSGTTQRMNEYVMEGGPLAASRSSRSFIVEVSAELGVLLTDDEVDYLSHELSGLPERF